MRDPLGSLKRSLLKQAEALIPQRGRGRRLPPIPSPFPESQVLSANRVPATRLPGNLGGIPADSQFGELPVDPKFRRFLIEPLQNLRAGNAFGLLKERLPPRGQGGQAARTSGRFDFITPSGLAQGDPSLANLRRFDLDTFNRRRSRGAEVAATSGRGRDPLSEFAQSLRAFQKAEQQAARVAVQASNTIINAFDQMAIAADNTALQLVSTFLRLAQQLGEIFGGGRGGFLSGLGGFFGSPTGLTTLALITTGAGVAATVFRGSSNNDKESTIRIAPRPV